MPLRFLQKMAVFRVHHMERIAMEAQIIPRMLQHCVQTATSEYTWDRGEEYKRSLNR